MSDDLSGYSLLELANAYAAFGRQTNEAGITDEKWQRADEMHTAIYKELERRDAELTDIRRTMGLCGIGDYKTWKDAQDEAYRVVGVLSAENETRQHYESYLQEELIRRLGINDLHHGLPYRTYEQWRDDNTANLPDDESEA
jgi:hypothetical protein